MPSSGTGTVYAAAGGGGPARADGGRPGASPPAATPAAATHAVARVELPGGRFLMGTEDTDGFPADGEGPVREVELGPFAIDATPVTNAAFARFVEDTGYVTESQRFGWSFVFAGFLGRELRRISPRTPEAPWWCGVQDAWWRQPEGPGSELTDRADHPVVQVSWADAVAYSQWAGGRLPTEAEWEYAARGGLSQARYAWGDELTPGGQHMCNIWQGAFPVRNTADDGYRGTCPVRAFPANGYGLYSMAGNTWEWVADYWGIEHGAQPARNPTGPATGAARVMRGGSYLCHDSYCNRYRVAARTQNEPDSAAGNLGFRCVYPAG